MSEEEMIDMLGQVQRIGAESTHWSRQAGILVRNAAEAFREIERLRSVNIELASQLETAIVWIEDSGNLYAPTQDEILPQLRAAVEKARGQ
jgi:DNA-binding TFAR19-related protein (PDSD5 family)